jgi:Lecithin retinol acyltransferase
MEIAEFFRNQESLQMNLIPAQTKIYPVSGTIRLVPGDHIVVLLNGLVYHHAIYIGMNCAQKQASSRNSSTAYTTSLFRHPTNRDGVPEVADFSSTTGCMGDNEIRIYELDELMDKKKWFGIVAYDQDSPEIRQRTISIARAFVDSKHHIVHNYNLISWNCECFVWLCKTGRYRESEQVKIAMTKLVEIIPSIIATVPRFVASSSSSNSNSMGCSIM